MAKFWLSTLVVLFFTSVSLSQTSGDCKDCTILKSQLDSTLVVRDTAENQFNRIKVKLTELDKLLSASTGSERDNLNNKRIVLSETFSKKEKAFENVKSVLAKVQQAYNDCINGEVDSDDNSCMKCENGKKVFNDGAFCDDGDPCTKNDRCVNGVCIGDPVTSNENPECAGGGNK